MKNFYQVFENEVKRLNPYILFLVFKLKITNGTCPRIAYAGPGRVMLTKIINKQLGITKYNWEQQED